MLEHLVTPTQEQSSPAPVGSQTSSLCFGPYRVLPESRQLLRDDQPVELGGRAFDLLMVLLEARGQVVAKADIFRKVWPSTTVDESNLRFQMATLRRALGCDRDVIKTVVGRGYLFAAETSGTSLHRFHEDGAERPVRATPTSDDAEREIFSLQPKNRPEGQLSDYLSARVMQLEFENHLLKKTLANLYDDRVVLVLSAAQSNGQNHLSSETAKDLGAHDSDAPIRQVAL